MIIGFIKSNQSDSDHVLIPPITDSLFLRTARPPSLCPGTRWAHLILNWSVSSPLTSRWSGLIRASPPPCSQAAAAPSTPSSSAVSAGTSGEINIWILSGQSNNLWVEFKSGHSAVTQGFQLTVLSVQGKSGNRKLQSFKCFCSSLLQRSWAT